MNRFVAVFACCSLVTAQAQEAISRVRPIASANLPPSKGPQLAPTVPSAPPVAGTSAAPETGPGFAPTWETQKHARTYLLGIPAPRGQIVDRHGNPLAQTRVSYNLGMSFPTPLNYSDAQVLAFAQRQVMLARALTGRPISLTQEQVLKHYKNRGVLPMVLAQDLKPNELENYHRENPANLTIQPVYQRFYPNGSLAGHIIGYAGRAGRPSENPIENNELLWPNAEGREGLEQSFDDQLQGKIGQFNISFDATGKKASEQISIPPQPGYNVVTALDADIQKLCEESLSKGAKRGAIVILDPNNGDILAMASWPTINPNAFVPQITTAEYKALNDDPSLPLIPRAYRSSYPPGSTFKVFVGLAALESGKVKPEEEFNCPASLEIGNLTFRNWKKEGAGMLNFADALTQSCNTWFYQVGMKMGGKLITDYCVQLGLGSRTGIPLNGEVDGRIPTDEYMMKIYKRRLLNGDVANLAIGQGDTLITPLQMAQAMGAIANGGTVLVPRLVLQVQSIDNQIVTAYDTRARSQVDIEPFVMKELRKGMIQVVSSRMGTAGRAAVEGIQVAGKTGTAQWGPKSKERTAAWFAGFAPAESPKYAFAALYESDEKEDAHGGTQAAPLIGRVLKDIFKDAAKEKKKSKKKSSEDEEISDDGMPVRRAEPNTQQDESD